MSQPTILQQRVLDFIRGNHLLSGQHKLLIAVSGGPDSVCLLHILVKLQKELDIKLYVAHLNHQLRGTASAADAQYVSDLADRLGIPATIDRRDVKKYQAQHRLSLEEAAREVRYAFLAQVAESISATQVAVGHTIDDHIETILMHLIRGAGTRGLRGLQSINHWQSSGQSLIVIRPLLKVSREETASYCRSCQLVPRIDVSNLSLSPLRNRIRHQLLPLLRSYNPRIADALLRTAGIATDDLAFLEEEVNRLWGEVAWEQSSSIVLDKAKFLELPVALQRHLLRAAVEKLLGSLKDIETRHIGEIMMSLNKSAGKRVTLPGNLIFSIEYDRYLISPDPAVLSPFPLLKAEFPLKIPGVTQVAGWRVEASFVSREQVGGKEDGFIAYFDFDKTGEKLSVRPRQPGDRFRPLGMRQPKKLGEFMIDAKIPQVWQQRIPIVCSPQHILWVVGWRIDDRVKVTEDTKKVLRLEFKQS